MKQLILSLLVIGGAAGDIAPVAGMQRLAPVFENSDLVCTCYFEGARVTGEHEISIANAPILRKSAVATLRVDDIFKSNETVQQEIEVAFEYDVPKNATRTFEETPHSSLVFLKKEAAGKYVFTNRTLAEIPFKGSLSHADAPFGLAKLEKAFAKTLDSPYEEDRVTALRLLEELDSLSAITIAQVGKLASAQNPEVALSALAVLTKSNPKEGLEALVTFFEHYQGGDTIEPFLTISSQIRHVTDISTLPSLERLSRSKFLGVRMAAVESLGRFAEASSTDTLAERLDDSNAYIQFRALNTLAKIFNLNGDYNPALGEFDRKPAYYISLWKRWLGRVPH